MEKYLDNRYRVKQYYLYNEYRTKEYQLKNNDKISARKIIYLNKNYEIDINFRLFCKKQAVELDKL